MKQILIKIVISGFMFIVIACSPKYACKQTIPGARCASLSDIYEEEVLGIKNDKHENDGAVLDDKEGGYEKRYYGTGTFPVMLVVSKKDEKEEKKTAEKEYHEKKGAKTDVDIIRDIRHDKDRVPILRPPKIARIWIAPWIDSSGDMNMESFIYTEIEGKKWILGEEAPASGNFGNVTGEFINKSIDALQ